MENFANKKASFLNNLSTLEKLLYSALGVVLIFGFIYFILPSFFKEKPISLEGICDLSVKDDRTVIAGWAFDGGTKQVVSNLKIHLLSKDRIENIIIPVKIDRVARPDVAKIFNASVEASGFGVSVPLDKINPGEYSIIVEQLPEDGVRVLCGSDKKLIVN